jgi:hypothetical protein
MAQRHGLTPTRQRLKDAIREALASGAWERISDSVFTIRYSERGLITPEDIRSHTWRGDTYNRNVFLSIVTGRSWSLILTVAPAPWVGARDQKVTFKRALAVLADPGAVFGGAP